MPEPTVANVSLGANTSLAKERLIWASRPMGFLFVMLWLLHPATASHTDYLHMSLIAFLVGIFYGVVVYGGRLRGYLQIVNKNKRHMPNRLPEEYYWGVITKTMYENK